MPPDCPPTGERFPTGMTKLVSVSWLDCWSRAWLPPLRSRQDYETHVSVDLDRLFQVACGRPIMFDMRTSLRFADARLQPLPVLCVSEREGVAWARSADLHDEAPILGEHFDIMVGLSSHNARERLRFILGHA